MELDGAGAPVAPLPRREVSPEVPTRKDDDGEVAKKNTEVEMLRKQDAQAVARAREQEQGQVVGPQLKKDEEPIKGTHKAELPSKSQRSHDQHKTTTGSTSTPAPGSLDAILATTTAAGLMSGQESVQYEPLRGQWHYGQAVLARYRKTPYFYSGNIATYLGAGLFMIVFDDGSLNYRVKREDIILRPASTMRSTVSEGDGNEEEDDASDKDKQDVTASSDHRITWYRTDVHLSDKPVMVDFSVSPPRQVSAGRAGYDVAEDVWLDVKHLECGVAYEDDSTQVSDSDDSSEEDMTMTPWQQMTQTFMGGGGGHRHHRQRASTRRSSVSSLSQIERLSVSGKSMNQILPSPKGIKQTIQDYLAKKTKKVQPSTANSDPVSDVVRTMEARKDQLLAIREGRLFSQQPVLIGGSVGRGSGGGASTPVHGGTPSPRQTSGPRLQRARSTTGSFLISSHGSGGRDRSASAASASGLMTAASFSVTAIGSILSPGGSTVTTASMASTSPSVSGSPSVIAVSPATNTRVVFQRESDGVRAYGTVMSQLPNGDYEVVAEGEQTIVVQVFPAKDLDFLPSIRELEVQIEDLQNQSKKLYVGRKVQVNLYPGTRFSGPGVITLDDDSPGTNRTSTAGGQRMFHVLLQNRIRLINVPADKLNPVKEKKKEPPRITEDQYLVCSGKVKVQIGDQVYVKCEGEYEGQIEEKLGVLNGVYSNHTAAVDFADGSTGYEIPPNLITKRKRISQTEDLDLLSLKNAVLMQANSSADGFQVDVGYQVKADHPRRASVESCVVIRKHESSACDLRFADGTIAFGVFPSQMIVDKCAVDATLDKTPIRHEAAVGEIVLAWSSRFLRYCSAKVIGKTMEGAHALYTIVFDYGEQKDQLAPEKIASIEDPDALSPTQKLTNYTFDTIGFEIQPVAFSVGEAVMARVHGSVQYYNGWVEAVREKERTCIVVFDSSERDEHVKFSSMFSVDVRNRFRSLGQPTCSGSSSASRVAAGNADDNGSEVSGASPQRNRRRHSASSVGSIIMSVAGSIFQARKKAERLERRASQLITEVGAQLRPVANEG